MINFSRSVVINFIVDSKNKKVQILFKIDFYDSAKKYFIHKISDGFNKKIDKENEQDYLIANVGYELTDDEYFIYQNLDLSIVDNAEYITLSNFVEIVNYINASTILHSVINRVIKQLKIER